MEGHTEPLLYPLVGHECVELRENMVAKNIGGNIACWLRNKATGETLKAVKVRVIPQKLQQETNMPTPWL